MPDDVKALIENELAERQSPELVEQGTFEKGWQMA